VGGKQDNDLTLDVRELRAMRRALADWQRRRRAWLPGGRPPGWGVPAGYEGLRWRGRARPVELPDGVVSLAVPERSANGARIVAHLRDAGSAVTNRRDGRASRKRPPGDWLVGVRYDLGGDLFLDAKRYEARAWKQGCGAVIFEEAEAGFVAAVAAEMSSRSTAE